MKSKIILTGIVAIIVAMLMIGCAKDNTTATFKVDKRIVGEWEDKSGNAWTFNDDGTGKVERREFEYTCFDGKIVIYNNYSGIYELTFSSDRKTLILHATSKDGYYWLTKK